MTYIRTRRFAAHAFALFIASAILTGCRTAPPAVEATTRPAETFDPSLNLASYDEMFSRIKESYFKPQRLLPPPDGIGWDAVQATYRPRIESARTMDEVRSTMNQAISHLGETHFGIIPNETYDDLNNTSAESSSVNDESAALEPGSVGIAVRIADRKAIVWQIDPDSSADAADVRAGWMIDSIDGDPVEDEIESVFNAFGDVPLTSVKAIGLIESRLSPSVGKSVTVGFRTVQGKLRKIKLTGAKRAGLWASFGNLPAMNLRFEQKKLPDNIGYFSLSVFLNPPLVMPAYSEFIKANQGAAGLIIDLRGNPGGIGVMATGMCGFLISDQGQKLGTMIRRDGSIDFIVNPRFPQFAGPVAVLVDQMSMSTSEILAGGLQDLKRARVFGEPTPGAALPSTVARLSNGDGLQFALADYLSAGGRRLEGNGIIPDVVIPLDRAALESGKDLTLEAASDWIVSQKSAAVVR